MFVQIAGISVLRTENCNVHSQNCIDENRVRLLWSNVENIQFLFND